MKCHIGQINARTIMNHSNRHVISDPKDKKQWEAMAIEGELIYTPEFLITGVLIQHLDWDKNLIQ